MKFLRYLLLPFALLYGLVLRFRHWCFRVGVFRSTGNFGVPVICVGNLNLGGTGKTPFVEFLIRRLSTQYAIGVVSRGYGRKTKGFLLATIDSTAEQIGDEPLQLFQKFQQIIQLVVCEDRVVGINRIIEEFPHLDLIILDDAFQHRKVRADVNVLLSPYDQPFYNDFLLPAGNLRDVKSSANRAGMLVFTKSPVEIPEGHREVAKRLLPEKLRHQFYYSTIRYGSFLRPFTGERLKECPRELVLVTGIARPEYIIRYLESLQSEYKERINLRVLSFPDHHNYTSADLDKIAKIFDTFAATEKAILTTEKDWVKLAPMVAGTAYRQDWLLLPISFELANEELFLQQLKNKLTGFPATANNEYLR